MFLKTRSQVRRWALAGLAAGMSQMLGAQPGTVDSSFDPGAGADQPVYVVLGQKDGRILIGGGFTTFNDIPRTNVARLNSGGALDVSFDPGAGIGGDFSQVKALALQADGRVLVGGSFARAGSPGLANLARLETNGVLDASFTVTTDDAVNVIVVQPDGRVLLGGFFTSVNGQPRSGLARLDTNGNVDATFHADLSGRLSAAFALALTSQGEILVAGSFTSLGGQALTNLALLESNGSVDPGFDASSTEGGQFSPTAYYTAAVDLQGRVLVGGDFASINGLAQTNVARFNTNDTLDSSFNPRADGPVNALAVLNDDKVVIAGGFLRVDGMARNAIARLNQDGSLDTDFDPGSGANDWIYAVRLQDDGRILAGGAFTTFAGIVRPGIVRLLSTASVPAPRLFNPVWQGGSFRVSLDTVAGRMYYLEHRNSISGGNWTRLPGVAGNGAVQVLTDPAATDVARFYRVAVE